MNVNLIPIKIKQRLNKLDSKDYDNLHCWQFVEAFNKAQRDWVRRQLHGGNLYKEGDESTKRRIDDLQILLTTESLNVNKKEDTLFISESLPSDYLEYKRLRINAKAPCGKLVFKSDLIEEANVDEYINDDSLKPSIEWRETFHTLSGNKINIYSDGNFSVTEANLVYYRQPKDISLSGCVTIENEDDGDINPEFKDDIVEVIIDEAVSILSSDIESPNQLVTSSERVTKNN